MATDKNFRVKNGLTVDGPNKDSSIIDGVLTLGSIGNINGTSSSVLAINSLGSVNINLDTNTNDTGSVFKIREDGADFFVMDNDGNVGIGTDTPAVNLHVSHATDPKIRVQDTTANYASTLTGYSGGAYLAMGDIDSSESSFLLFGAFSSINNLNTKSRDFHLYGTNTTTGLYFDESAGKFGIGTTSPNQILTLEGTMSLKEQASANADTAAYGQLWVKSDSPNNLYFTNDDGDDVQITNGASIASSGGIASVAADSTPQLGGDLDVNGNKITSASNADVTIEPNGTGDINLYTDKVVVGDSSTNFEIQHRTTTNSLLRFQAGGNTQLISDAAIYLNADEGGAGGSASLIRVNALTTTIGKNNNDATLTTAGTGDLTLSTNSGTNSGTITIADGANGNISLTPNGTGNVALGNFTFNADQTVGSGQDNYVLTYDNSAGTIGLEEASGGGSPGGSDTFIQYNNGGSFGATTFSYDDSSGAEQYKIDVSSSVAPLVLVQTGAGNAFEVHDAADPDNNRFEIDQFGRVTIRGSGGAGYGAALYVGGDFIASGTVAVEGGTVSDLSFTNAQDTNTGMYFPAADNLGFSTGGTERFRFGSSGEILIGGSAAGTSGQVLTSGGSGAAVTWEDAASGGSPGGSDTFVQYNNGGSFGATTLSYDDTAGSEQFLFDDTSDQPLVKIVQRGSGHAFEVHDQASDSSIFTISEVGQVTIKTATPQAGGLTINDDMYVGQIKSSSFGSASSPRYTFHSDTNTGMYSGGADVLKFTTGGTERVKLSSSGLQLGASGAEVTTIATSTSLGTSNTTLSTTGAIKAYVDANAGGGSSSGTVDKFVAIQNTSSGDSNPVINVNVTTPVAITWLSEVHKDSIYTHSTSSSPENITVTEAGTYLVSYNINTENTGGNRFVPKTFVYINGSQLARTLATSYSRGSVYDSVTTATWTGIIELSANDIVNVRMGKDDADQTSQVRVQKEGTSISLARIAAVGNKTTVIAATGATTLTNAQSGSVVYITGSGSVTLPSSMEKGVQFVIINDTGSDETIGENSNTHILGTHGAMPTNTARTYVAVSNGNFAAIG